MVEADAADEKLKELAKLKLDNAVQVKWQNSGKLVEKFNFKPLLMPDLPRSSNALVTMEFSDPDTSFCAGKPLDGVVKVVVYGTFDA